MIIAIAADGNSLQSKIDPRFGRCAYFAFYDTESKKVEFKLNEAKDASEGAGPAAVQFVANNGASKVVAGEFGFKIKSLLDELEIQMIMMKDDKSVDEIIALSAK